MSLTHSGFEATWNTRWLSSIAILLASCSGAAGHGWVDDARCGQVTVTGSLQAEPLSIRAKTEPEAREAARPRLNHTVTLGEIEVAPESPAADAPFGAAPSNPSVTINNYNVVNLATPAGYGYAAVGYGSVSPSFSVGRRAPSSSSAVTPGQSWPVIADHGPSFPYHSGPASPWERPR